MIFHTPQSQLSSVDAGDGELLGKLVGLEEGNILGWELGNSRTCTSILTSAFDNPSLISTHASNTVERRLVVIPPTTRLTIKPLKKGNCSSILMPTSKAQYKSADFFRPNRSISGPVIGAVKAPVMNPKQYKEATENPYPSYKTYKCVPAEQR